MSIEDVPKEVRVPHHEDFDPTGRVLSDVRKVWDKPQEFELGHGVSMRGLHLHVTGIEVREHHTEDRWFEPTYDEITIRVVVGERDTGMPLGLAFNLGVDPLPTDPRERRDALKEVVLKVLDHELDELLLVAGERVADPHAPRSIKMLVECNRVEYEKLREQLDGEATRKP